MEERIVVNNYKDSYGNTLVSYKLAKKLCEAGYEEESLYKYIYDSNQSLINPVPVSFGAIKHNLNLKTFCTCSCITFDAIAEWVRSKNLYVDIVPIVEYENTIWVYKIIDLQYNNKRIIKEISADYGYFSYEDCFEEGMYNALEYIEHLK